MNLDGYESSIIGMRRFAQGYEYADPVRLYASGGLYGRVIDLPAEKATERGIECDAETSAEIDRLSVMESLGLALKWSRLCGGGCIVALTDDGELREPLNLDRVTSIEELKVFSLPEIAPSGEVYADPRQANYGQPASYRVSVARAQFVVHESRVIPVPGDPLPRQLCTSGIPWHGRDAATRPYRTIENYLTSQSLSVSILRRKQQAVYAMDGLAEMISAGLEDQIQKRINLVDKVRGILNTVAVDSADKYDIKDMSLSGIKDVMEQFQIALSAESGIPVSLLFGRSAAGENATGEGDFNAFYDMVAGDQRTKLTPAMQRILALIYAQNGVDAPDNWEHITWLPLERMSDKEMAEVAKTKASALALEMQALNGAIESSALSETEAREYLESEGRFGIGA